MESRFFEPPRETIIGLKSRTRGTTTITGRNPQGSAPQFVQRYTREEVVQACQPHFRLGGGGVGVGGSVPVVLSRNPLNRLLVRRSGRFRISPRYITVLVSLFDNMFIFFLLNLGFENRSYTTAKPTDDGIGRLLGSECSGQSSFVKIPDYDPSHLTDCTYHMHNTSQNSYSIHKNMVSFDFVLSSRC